MASTSDCPSDILTDVTERDWAWVHKLICDVQLDEHRENIQRFGAIWLHCVRQFLEIELKMACDERFQTPGNLAGHKRTCEAAIDAGRDFLTVVANHNANLATDGKVFDPQPIENELDILQDSWDTWHTKVSPERLQEIEGLLFGGTS